MESPINKTLEEIRYMSYFHKNHKICDYNVLYFKLGEYWFEILSSDGVSKFQHIKEQGIIALESFSD